MGYTIHRAAIITSWKPEDIEAARAYAANLFGERIVTLIVLAPYNGFASFMIAPAGGKMNSDEDVLHANRLLAFRHWLDCFKFGDGSSTVDAVLVEYGRDMTSPKAAS